jgi:hypothetical protein
VITGDFKEIEEEHEHIESLGTSMAINDDTCTTKAEKIEKSN